MKIQNNNRILYIVGTCAVGFLISLWITYIHIRIHLEPMYDSTCKIEKLFNFGEIAASRFSVMANIPVSVFAILFYFIFGFTALAAIFQKNYRYSGIMAILGMLAGIGTLTFIYISIFLLKTIFLGCLVIDGINFTLAVFSMLRARQLGGIFKCIKSDFYELKYDKWILSQLSAFIILFTIAGPLGGFPRYWELASWKTGVPFHQGMANGDLPWIGAASPTLIIQEYFDYECPACRSSHKKIRKLLSNYSNDIRIIRHDMSRIECINKEGAGIKDRCVVARAAFCAGAQNHFWELNDAFVADPQPKNFFQRSNYITDLAAHIGLDKNKFIKCFQHPKTFAHVQEIYKDGIKKGIQSTPSYFINKRKMNSKEILIFIKNL